jgi:hypothetical protein
MVAPFAFGSRGGARQNVWFHLRSRPMSGHSFVEGLESRMLLSAAPAPVLFNPTLRADRLAVRADFLRFQSDALSGEAKLLTDTQAIKHNLTKGDTSLVTPFAQLHTDVKAMRLALREDRLAESVKALSDESTIKHDILQILKDRKNATAEVADHAKLKTDRITLQVDLMAGLDFRIATRQQFLPTISNDVNAIVTAANNDPNASAALKAAAATFGGDRTTVLTTLTGDLQIIATARAKLVNDLAAAQST